MRNLKEIFQPRLYQAEQEFGQFVESISSIDPLDLPPSLQLEVEGLTIKSYRRVSGPHIPMFVWEDDEHPPQLINQVFTTRPDSQNLIVHVLDRQKLPDPCWVVLLLPELIPWQEAPLLSIGLGKLDNGQFFTAWTDSHLHLTTKRQTSKTDYLGLIQYCYWPDSAQQLLANQAGAAYFFTTYQPVTDLLSTPYLNPLLYPSR